MMAQKYWVVFGWRAELYSKEKYSDTKQSAGSHIQSCWLLWHEYMRGPNLCPTISWRLEQGHNLQTSEHAVCEWHVYVHQLSMLVQKNQQNLMEFKTGEHANFPGAHQEWIVPHVVEMEALLHQIEAAGVVVDQLCWNMKSIMAIRLQVSVCKTDVPISGSQIDHQGSCYLYSLWSSCTSTMIESKGQTSNQVLLGLYNILDGKVQ